MVTFILIPSAHTEQNITEFSNSLVLFCAVIYYNSSFILRAPFFANSSKTLLILGVLSR